MMTIRLRPLARTCMLAGNQILLLLRTSHLSVNKQVLTSSGVGVVLGAVVVENLSDESQGTANQL